MPMRLFSESFSSSKFDVIIIRNPFFNRTVDGFLKIGAVGASKVAVEETYDCLKKGKVTKDKLEDAFKKMCKEGAYWGTIAGVYVGIEYGMERIRGTSDWKNAMLSGAATGALLSAASGYGGDKVIANAITGGAMATAAELINYLT